MLMTLSQFNLIGMKLKFCLEVAQFSAYNLQFSLQSQWQPLSHQKRESCKSWPYVVLIPRHNFKYKTTPKTSNCWGISAICS